MSSDPFRKVRPGDDLAIPASTWNSAIDRAKAFARSGGAIGGGETPRSGWIVPVLNDTGGDLPRASVIGLDGPIFPPSLSLDAFLQGATFRGVVPDASHADRFAVTLGPIPAGQAGRAFVSGVFQTRIDILDESHTCAHASEGDTEKLVSGSGPAQILWKESGTGTKWAIVRKVGACGPVAEPPCTTTVNVCVRCDFTPQIGVTVEAIRGEEVIDSCVTATNGCCALVVPGEDPVTIKASNSATTITPNCSAMTVNFDGKTCAGCFADGPAMLTLQTPYGDVALNKGFGGTYSAIITGFSAPNVSGMDCSNILDDCGANLATRDIILQYGLICSGNVVSLGMATTFCRRCQAGSVIPGSQQLAICTTPGTTIGTCPAFDPNIRKIVNVLTFTSDSITLDNCVPCVNGLEFLLDYTQVGGSPSIVTLNGLEP